MLTCSWLNKVDQTQKQTQRENKKKKNYLPPHLINDLQI